MLPVSVATFISIISLHPYTLCNNSSLFLFNYIHPLPMNSVVFSQIYWSQHQLENHFFRFQTFLSYSLHFLYRDVLLRHLFSMVEVYCMILELFGDYTRATSIPEDSLSIIRLYSMCSEHSRNVFLILYLNFTIFLMQANFYSKNFAIATEANHIKMFHLSPQHQAWGIVNSYSFMTLISSHQIFQEQSYFPPNLTYYFQTLLLFIICFYYQNSSQLKLLLKSNHPDNCWIIDNLRSPPDNSPAAS